VDGRVPGTVRSPGRFGIVVERLGADTLTLRLSGELDLAAMPALACTLRRVRRSDVASVLVDAADLGFVDLGAVIRLCELHEALLAVGGGVLVIHPPDSLLRVLALLDELELPVLA
jgi:ABC-type transporter Mla MlaB component